MAGVAAQKGNATEQKDKAVLVKEDSTEQKDRQLM